MIAEQSLAAVCPSISWHLAGTKKVQQKLSRRGVLEKFLSDPDVINNMRSTFAGQYSLELVSISKFLINNKLYYYMWQTVVKIHFDVKLFHHNFHFDINQINFVKILLMGRV